jgi:hypothetical protein
VLKTYIENCSCWSRRDLNYVSDESEQIHLWSNIISDGNWKMELREIKRGFLGRNMKFIFLLQISKSLCRFLSMLLDSTVNCRDYVASVISEWMSMVHWWHDTESRKLKYSKKNLSECHIVCYESHMDWPGIGSKLF